MNPFLLPPSERLAAWRDFRGSLVGLEEKEQLSKVASWIALAPTSTYVLDYDNPQTWPSPWDLINQGDFDDVAKVWLALKTLLFMGWAPERFTLAYVRNTEESFQTMILLVDNQEALNYRFSGVINFDNERQNCAYLVSYRVNPEGGLEQA